MDKLDAMQAFTRVVTTGSFAEAGRRLGLTRSAISKAVAELEHLLGARLLDRTTRRVSPTHAGRAYYERCLDILAAIDETELQVAQLHDQPRGTLKLNAPMSFGTLHLGAAIAEFARLWPDLKVEMVLSDRFVNPLEEGVDVTIRIGQLEDSSLIARRLAPCRRLLVAAPDYLAAHGTPETPEDLARHRCLVYGHSTSLQKWTLTTPDGGTIRADLNATMCCNNGEVLRAAAVAGNGITALPSFITGPDIAAGRLAVVLPDHPPTALDIFALYAPNRYLAAKSRLLIDFLVARFAGVPVWDRFDGREYSS
ncbi:LysR family transcriptional regulator (plasmid) [Tistrella mobilis]|uniref:LysR family transcriptional regulator n=1 Tax=Tistrella mobilis TaxID=171437 RepID=UPI0035569226